MTSSVVMDSMERMRIVCQQPHFFPWLGYFDLFHCDRFVFLDSVQWTKQGRIHRTKIYIDGKPNWLTVPVHSKGHRDLTIKEMRIDQSQNWIGEHRRLLERAYGKAPFYHQQLKEVLERFYEKAAGETFLADLCQESLYLFLEKFKLNPELFWSSELPSVGQKSEKIISLVTHLGGEEYYSSLGSTRYLDLSLFRSAGIQVRWQHFRHFFPDDIHRPADLSILDWLAYQPYEVMEKILAPKSLAGSEIEVAIGIQNELTSLAPHHLSRD